MTLNEADKVVHTVENESHYRFFAKFGFIPLTREAKGLVRSYEYKHPNIPNIIKYTIGAHADYWTDQLTQKGGYWPSLEMHLEELVTTHENSYQA